MTHIIYQRKWVGFAFVIAINYLKVFFLCARNVADVTMGNLKSGSCKRFMFRLKSVAGKRS